MAAAQLGIKLRFEGTGVEEKGIVVSVTGHDAPGVKPGDVIVQVDPRYFRPAEVEKPCWAPNQSARNWAENQTTLQEMVSEMVAKILKQRKTLPAQIAGYEVAIAGVLRMTNNVIFCRRSSRNGGFSDCSPAGAAR